jgi:hypothetical protein
MVEKKKGWAPEGKEKLALHAPLAQPAAHGSNRFAMPPLVFAQTRPAPPTSVRPTTTVMLHCREGWVKCALANAGCPSSAVSHGLLTLTQLKDREAARWQHQDEGRSQPYAKKLGLIKGDEVREKGQKLCPIH